MTRGAVCLIVIGMLAGSTLSSVGARLADYILPEPISQGLTAPMATADAIADGLRVHVTKIYDNGKTGDAHIERFSAPMVTPVYKRPRSSY